jgi:diaminopimelate epimerase
MCGNGIRCYMKYLIDNNITDKKTIKVETWAGILTLSIEGSDIVTATMWKPKIIDNKYQNIDKHNIYGAAFARGKLFKFIPISMWNPHAVIFLKRTPVGEFDVDTYGSVIESDTEIFPNKTNVEFIERISDTEINMRVYERWAWETLACGTGACASVVAGILSWQLVKDEFVRVNLKWGILEIKWSGNMKDEVIMRGRAETSFEGEYFIK